MLSGWWWEQSMLAPWSPVWLALIESSDIVLWMKGLFVPLISLHLLYPQASDIAIGITSGHCLCSLQGIKVSVEGGV